MYGIKFPTALTSPFFTSCLFDFHSAPSDEFFSAYFFVPPLTSQFAGLEGVITAMLDEFPHILVKRREWFVFGLVCVCYLGALSTLTYVS